MKKILVSIGVCLACMSVVVGTTYCSRDYMANKTNVVYDSDSGLPTGKANDIVQTGDGFIYIAQYTGLTRYNGKVFSTIEECYIDNVKYNLTGIVDLYVDSSDRLWIGTQNDYVFCYEKGIFTHYSAKECSAYVEDICESNGTVYVATNNGVFSIEDNQAKTIKGIPSKNIYSIASHENTVFYTYNNQAYCYENGAISPFHDLANIKTIEVIGDNIYFGGKNGTAYIYDLNTDQGETFIVDEKLEKPINSFEYKNGVTFIATDNAVFTYENGNVDKIEGTAIDTAIEKVMVDYEGTLWICSSAKGIEKILDNIFEDVFFKANITKQQVNAIAEYKGVLYLGCEKGIQAIDLSTYKQITNTLTEFIGDSRIRDFYVGNDRLYVAVYGGKDPAVAIYNGTEIKKINCSDLDPNGNSVDSSQFGSGRTIYGFPGGIVIGTNGGLAIIDDNDVKIASLACERILDLNVIDGDIYACTEGQGLKVYDTSLNCIKKIEDNDWDDIILEKTTPLKTLAYDGGVLFCVGSTLYYNKAGITKRVNLELTGCSIVELNFINGQFWIGTDGGIYIFNENELNADVIKTKHYYKGEGLKQGIVGNSSSYYDEIRKKYYFCTTDGAYAVDVNNMQIVHPQSKMAISNVYVDGTKNLGYDAINLDKNTYRVSFDISVLSFLKEDNIYIRYKLEGFEKNYTTLNYKEVNSISYTNLKGGNYTFVVERVDEYGNVISDQARISVLKEKHIYEHLYFMILVIILIILLVGGIAFFYTRVKLRAAIKRQNEYKEITVESIEAIAGTIDAKDSYTNGHSLRVGAYSRIIAAKLGMKGQELENLYYIALLHDIGKIGIPDNILKKPSKLTNDEFNVIKTHTVKGATILHSMKTIPHLTDGVKYHHERYDGFGYPFGLKGEEIPLTGRIICCADAFDAMYTDRVYRPRLTKEQIIAEFTRCSGKQFDPKIVKVVIELVKNDELVYRGEELQLELEEKD